MTNQSLSDRLQLKPNQSVLLLNAPPGYVELLQPLPPGCSISAAASGLYAVAHFFAMDSAELGKLLSQAIAAIQPDGVLWIAYPKKSSGIATDLTRDAGWAAVADAGWRPVRQIAIDEVWSALRFKPAALTVEGDPVAAQYAGEKASLRPIYERLVKAAQGLGDDVTLEARQSYVALRRANHFAAIQPSTRSRVDLALKLKGEPATARLQANSGVGGGALTHKVALASVGDVDNEVIGWLTLAYERTA